jgi:SET domain-containing protein
MRRMSNGGANQLFAIKRTITGLGLIALKRIPKGKRIIEYFGPLITNEEVERRNGKYFFGVDKKWSIDGSPRDNLARYINHSCKPNAEAIVSQRRRVWIWATKNIKPGEEITYDYGDEYFEGVIKPHGCRCRNCRSRRRRKGTPKNRRIC